MKKCATCPQPIPDDKLVCDDCSAKLMIRPDQHSGQNALPIEIQAFIESRVNTAIDAAREILRQDAREARREATVRGRIKFAVVTLITMAIGILLWILGPSEVKQWTKEFVATNMTKPVFEAAAKDVVSNKLDLFV